MPYSNTRINPFLIQCFVTVGVTINMAGMGVVMGFATVLLPQLRLPDSEIQIDDSSGSWLASMPGIALVIGNFVMPSIMGRFGRKPANLLSLIVTILGWLCIVLSYNIQGLLAARFVQGIAMGMIAALGPALIGEYTSPKNRGAFLMSISVSISAGVLTVQTMGSYLGWHTTAMIYIAITIINLVIVVLSPESPTFLADKGKYDECRKVFKYLRGDNENDELEKMIIASDDLKKENGKLNATITKIDYLKTKLNYLKVTMRKEEFYKPLLIMLHLYSLAQWSGVNILTSYTADLVTHVIGPGFDVNMMVITSQIHRIVANCIGIVLIKTIRRRTMLLVLVIINLLVNASMSGYTYAKAQNYLPYDHPAIGIILIHIQIFSIGTGALPLCYILAGEIFPMEYKSLCGGLSTLFMSLNLFANVKTTPLFFKTIGIYGSLCVHCAVMAYCLLFLSFTLPETKDRTLQDIEDELRGKKGNDKISS